MGILFDKEPESSSVIEKEGPKPFSIYIEKYKTVVAITSLKVSDTDDSMLEIEFDHSIDAPSDEVQEEVGRIIIKKLEDSISQLEKTDLVMENEKIDGESV
jgi:hypothetical protein